MWIIYDINSQFTFSFQTNTVLIKITALQSKSLKNIFFTKILCSILTNKKSFETDRPLSSIQDDIHSSRNLNNNRKSLTLQFLEKILPPVKQIDEDKVFLSGVRPLREWLNMFFDLYILDIEYSDIYQQHIYRKSNFHVTKCFYIKHRDLTKLLRFLT